MIKEIARYIPGNFFLFECVFLFFVCCVFYFLFDDTKMLRARILLKY